MATKKERKISYFTLFKKQWETRDTAYLTEFTDLLKFIYKKKKLDKQVDIGDSKFFYLDNYSDKDAPVLTGFFTSAKHKFRPNLLDQKTGEERPSPKKITEGEKEKTHFSIKMCENEIFILLELNGNGVSIIQIVNYLNNFLKVYLKKIGQPRDFSIDYLKVGRDNFLEILSDLKRVRIAEIFLNKSLLGSKFLNFSNRTFAVQNDLILTAKAVEKESIKEAAIDLFNASSKENGISRVRIEGIDNNGTEIKLDTTFIEKVDSLSISLNPTTGEIETIEMLSALKGLTKSVN